jgi:endonuclease/exonuclease/phosphatase (EEP) superfamily protein YafD
MPQNCRLDDVEDLKTKVEAKANILFRKRSGVAPLYVSRTLTESDEIKENSLKYAQNQEVQTLSEIEQLQKVKLPSLPAQLPRGTPKGTSVC